MSSLRIALLHFAPELADLEGNRRRIEAAVRLAAAKKADWIVTPELATTGYGFAERVGTSWIEAQPDTWSKHIAALAKALNVVIFLSVPERDDASLYNSMLAIDQTGEILGRHRKINTLRIGAEAWSTPGDQAEVVYLSGFGKVGMLICADACSPSIAKSFGKKEVRAVLSSAAWAPGLYGPSGEWEAVSSNARSPVFVANRTGREPLLDFTPAKSVAAFGGKRIFSRSSIASALFFVEWDFATNELTSWLECQSP